MKSDRKLIVEPTAESATALCAEMVRSVICQAVSEREVCSIALSGGTTPHALYQQLAQTAGRDDLPWGRVEVFFGDERDVPADHAESNYGMAQRTLLDNVPVEPRRVHPMPGDAADLAAAARQYEQEVRQVVPAGKGGTPELDLVLLGMGGDAHVASLFPFTEAVGEQKSLVTAYFVPVLGRRRMTMTFPLINAARNVIMLVTGADKAQAVADVLSAGVGDGGRLPAANLEPAGALIIILDAQAASRLP